MRIALMTLRSRLSAAWRAFRQDDFPPTVAERATPVFAINFKTNGGEPFCIHALEGDQSYAGPTRECPMHGTNPPVRLDLKANTTYHVSAPKSEAEYADEMRAASRPSMVDECEAMARERDASLARMEQSLRDTNASLANIELPALSIKRRKKLASVPKE